MQPRGRHSGGGSGSIMPSLSRGEWSWPLGCRYPPVIQMRGGAFTEMVGDPCAEKEEALRQPRLGGSSDAQRDH